MKIFALLLISIGSAFGQTLNVGTFNVFPITNFPFVTSFQLWAVPITGQSLANGASSTGISTNNYPYDAYTSENGPDQSGIFGGIQLVPSKEKSSAETITTAWMVQAASMGATNFILSAVSALGGAAYSNINKGTIYYAGCLDVMTNAFRNRNANEQSRVPPNYGLTLVGAICPAVMVLHGDTDSSNPYYQQDLEQWAGDFTSDAQRIFGQTNVVKLFHCQISAISTVGETVSSMAMLAEQEAPNRTNLVVTPRYFLPYGAVGSPHLSSAGYQWIGEYYGKAFYKEILGTGWEPLRPISVTRSSAVITVTFTNTIGGLVFDTTSYPSVNQATNYGFNYVDDSSSATISSVVISGATSNQLTITLNTTPTGANKEIRGAIWPTSIPSPTGTTNIMRTNLRNQDPTIGILSGLHLYDWCVAFRKTVP